MLAADLLPGGRAAGRRPEQFDRCQLAIGTLVELEHTGDVAVAREIAMDHLVEDPRYYEKLRQVHLDSATGYSRWQTIGWAALIALGSIAVAYAIHRQFPPLLWYRWKR